MQCPIDQADLLLSEREGIEIDYCPKCRGVWLDRSELDKIIERSTSRGHGRRDDREVQSRNDRDYDRRDDRRNQGDDEEGGFLGNLFGGFDRDND